MSSVVTQAFTSANPWTLAHPWYFTPYVIVTDSLGNERLVSPDHSVAGQVTIYWDTATTGVLTLIGVESAPDGGGDETGVVLGDTATAYDFEAGNTQTVYYRARALHDYSGVYAASDWVVDSDAWSDENQWWLKSVLTPALNQPVEVHSEPGARRPARQGRFQALGGTHAIVLSDTRASTEGSIVLRADTDSELAAIRALVDDTGTLLLQGAPNNHWVDKYVQVGDLEVQRLVDKSFVEGWLVTLPWIEVESPTGAITAWREVGS